jgi:hypothetical protein
MAVTIKHAKTDNIANWTQPDLDAQIALGNFPPGTLLADIVLPSDWNSDHTFTGTLPVANGGTGVTTSSGANSVVLRDANANITTNCLFEGFTSQAASGTTIVLTASSVQNFQITGSGGQTIKLPDATTLPNGALFTFNNNQSSGAIIVQNHSSTTVDTIQSGGFSVVTLLDNSIAAGSWDKHNQSPANVSWSTNTFDYPGSITSATWNGNAIALNRGGTNANLTAVNGGAVYSTGSALAITAAGTAGQVLQSNGASAPTWVTSPTAGAGGSTTQVQYNNAGVLAGSANFTFNGTTVTTANDASISGLKVGKGGGAVATNTAVGVSALNANTTASGSTAVGYQAGFTNLTGNGNTNVGYQAGYFNTLGFSSNVGYQAGYNTTGAGTTDTLGYQACLANTTGGQNVGIGYQALLTNSTSNYNIGIGTFALKVTTGNSNIGIGASSGSLITTGSSNTLLGTNAGATGTNNLTTGSNNTIIGYNAAASSATVSNEITLGNSSVTSLRVPGIAATFGTDNSTISTLTVGKGIGALANNTAVGNSALAGSNSGTGNNVAVGYLAMQTNTTGNTNTAVGTLSLRFNSVGNNNVAIGYGTLTNSLGSGNTAVGYNSLTAQTTGSANTAFGLNALSNNVTANFNTALGYQCLSNNSTGANNVGVGVSALAANTTAVATLGSITGGTGGTDGTYTGVVMTLSSGSAAGVYPTATIVVAGGTVTTVTLTAFGSRFIDTTTVLTAPTASIGNVTGFTVPVATLATGGSNTAVGYQALQANTTASQNVAVGQSALAANTTGTSNTAIGFGAGASTVTGGLNTFVGYQSGSANVGSRGVYVGYQAGYNATNTGATYNTAVGTFALNSTASSVGYFNTAVGGFSLYTITSGNQNTAIGYGSGQVITSGTNNTLLGYGAGNSGTNNLTTGSNNIIIGYNAAASSATVSNEITIGNSSCTSLRLAPLITGYTSAAPTIASAATIAPTKPISFVSGTTTVDTITAPAPISAGGGSITLIPTGVFATSTAGNIALATTAVVGKALILTYDATTTKWYPSY